MRWNLTWGQRVTPDGPTREEQLRLQAERTGVWPDALKNKPAIRPWLVKFYDAFNTLSAARPVGMGGVGPIPLSEMFTYFLMYEVEPAEYPVWVRMIRGLDATYLTLQSERREREVGKSSSYTPPPRTSPQRRRR